MKLISVLAFFAIFSSCSHTGPKLEQDCVESATEEGLRHATLSDEAARLRFKTRNPHTTADKLDQEIGPLERKDQKSLSEIVTAKARLRYSCKENCAKQVAENTVRISVSIDSTQAEQHASLDLLVETADPNCRVVKVSKAP